MEKVLDLPIVGRVITEQTESMKAEGYEVGPLTWRDVGVAWPYPFVATFEAAVEPDSVGIHIIGQRAESRLVFFMGGWADLSFYDGSDEPFVDAPSATAPLEVLAIVGRFIGLFRASEGISHSFGSSTK